SMMILASQLNAQSKAKNDMIAQANSLFEAKDWENAIAAYQSVVKQDAKNGKAWLYLGLSYHSLGNYEQAIKAYEEADRLQFYQWQARYNIACAYSLMNNKEEAFQWLDKALGVGLNQIQLLENDSDLAILRDDMRFQGVLEAADKNARPCEYSEQHRQFDFWVGEWDVFNGQGQQVGTNVIQKILNGCVLHETWSAPGQLGKSFSYFDPGSGKWKQNWVQAQGGIIWYEGELQDGVMHFTGESILFDGSKQLARGSFTPLPDGRVRQFLEQSPDEGKTWYVTFDGIYVKKSASGGRLSKFSD
ncbi:MAG TPA: tetratricopeptide repeat protein, partial [bacterium]